MISARMQLNFTVISKEPGGNISWFVQGHFQFKVQSSQMLFVPALGSTAARLSVLSVLVDY